MFCHENTLDTSYDFMYNLLNVRWRALKEISFFCGIVGYKIESFSVALFGCFFFPTMCYVVEPEDDQNA